MLKKINDIYIKLQGDKKFTLKKKSAVREGRVAAETFYRRGPQMQILSLSDLWKNVGGISQDVRRSRHQKRNQKANCV